MPPPFRELSVAQFADEVAAYTWTRPVFRVDMHHTFHPSHAEWRGRDSVEGMWRFHTLSRGFEDIAQHVSIAPDGAIWTGRDWNKTPASVGCNMNAQAFMFEAIGNFDVGHDLLDGAQRFAVVAVIDIVQRHFRLPVQALLFHREVPQTPKTCPGTGIDKGDILRAVAARRALA
ncbi:MAG: N-acetylmuramoyl-L-alanine amidase [Hyphomicrobiaceae bacterium]|nr:N-acetylmuramoyl-L-alanine amidase [Hyphomicrobiaceae bacterium]